MSGLSISVDDRSVRRKVRHIQHLFDDLKPVFSEVGQGWLTFVDLCFRHQVDPWGVPWKELSDTTLMLRGQKALIGKTRHTFDAARVNIRTRSGNTKVKALRAIANAKILIERGILRNSMAYSADEISLSVGTIEKYGAPQFLGMKKGEAGTMRNGRPIPWGDIPPRPALPFRPGGVADLPDHWSRLLFDTVERHVDR